MIRNTVLTHHDTEQVIPLGLRFGPKRLGNHVVLAKRLQLGHAQNPSSDMVLSFASLSLSKLLSDLVDD